jgi:hypothetical protein
VIMAAADRLSVQIGRRFFPTVPEWVTACADVVDDRRKQAAAQVKALTEECADCHGSGWADVEGPNAVTRCLCTTRALELLRTAGEPLARPALPSYEGEA